MTQEQNDPKAKETTVRELSTLDSLFEKVSLKAPEAGTAGTEESGLSQALSMLIHSVAGQKLERVDKALVDSVIADLDRRMSAQINEILHQESFQKLESAWRGLKFLVERTDFRRNVKLEVLNVSKEELATDFADSPEPYQSGLFRHLYIDEYDQAGGEPIAAMLANYEFSNHPSDLALLSSVSKIAAGTHAPFIASVGAKFFGLDSITTMEKMPDVAPIFEKPEYAKWREFRKTEDARYVGLTLPRFLLRLPYGADTNPTNLFNFEEDARGEDHGKYLWGNASFAFGQTLVQSFAANGWCVNIRGPQSGGKIEDLPLHVFQSSGDTVTKVPTEMLISDRREYELSEQLGLIPLTFYKNRDYACFFSATSIQNPKKYLTADATANAKLCARLPYLFLVSRLAHYLKVIQRENIGAAKEKDDLQKELNTWIKTLVTEMKDPSAELKAKCPLSSAQITVSEIAENPGFYQVEMLVRPHFQVEGVDVNLSLVSRLPRAKKN
jgi:type VI secretion system protein ImpC